MTILGATIVSVAARIEETETRAKQADPHRAV
jgi:hypothetical protein